MKIGFKRLLTIALIVLLISGLAVAAVAVGKRSDLVPGGDAYGSYYNNEARRAAEKSITIDSKNIRLKYVRTENLKEKAAARRADNYGTYDVYVDDVETEYLYLLNSDIYCGFKMAEVGEATAKSEAIAEETALNISEEFLMANRGNYTEYELMSCQYSELAGYYDIQYYLPINGYKSDDIIRLWVNAEGEVTSFSEFNYKRYENIEIDAAKYAKAESKIDRSIAGLARDSDIEVADTYVSLDDSGKLILTKVVDVKAAGNSVVTVQTETYVERIR